MSVLLTNPLKKQKRFTNTSCLSNSLEKEWKNVDPTQLKNVVFIDHLIKKSKTPVSTDFLIEKLDNERGISLHMKKYIFIKCNEIVDQPTLDKVLNYVEKCKITSGECVGVIAAQSFSERLTQITLNSFHLSGMKRSPVAGMQSIFNMLEVRKNLDTPVIYPIHTNYETMIEKTIGDVVESYGIKYYYLDEKYNVYCPFVKVKDDMSKSKLINWLNEQKIQFVEDDDEILFLLKKTKKVSYDPEEAIRLMDEDYEKQKKKTKSVKDKVKSKIVVSNNTSIANARHNLEKILSFIIQGIPACKEYDHNTKSLGFTTKTSLETIGFDMFYDCGLSDEEIYKIRSNDLMFIYHNLGIEAVRTYLMDSIPKILKNEGISLNLAHIELIVDNITYKGEPQPNTRHGMDTKDSVLVRASFETAMNTFVDAALNRYTDNLKSISSAIILGNTSKIGSCFGDVLDKSNHIDETQEQVQVQYYVEKNKNAADLFDESCSQEPSYVPCSPVPSVNESLNPPLPANENCSDKKSSKEPSYIPCSPVPSVNDSLNPQPITIKRSSTNDMELEAELDF